MRVKFKENLLVHLTLVDLHRDLGHNDSQIRQRQILSKPTGSVVCFGNFKVRPSDLRFSRPKYDSYSCLPFCKNITVSVD